MDTLAPPRTTAGSGASQSMSPPQDSPRPSAGRGMEMPDPTDQEMSTRAMPLLGGVSTVVMAAVLGLSLLFGIGGKATQVAQSQPVAGTAVPASGGAGRPAAPVVVPALVGVDSMTAT